MTNNEYMEQFLGKRCQHDHEHERIEGKIWLGGHWVNRSQCSQVYPKQMVEAMVCAIKKQKNKDGLEVLAVEKLSEISENMEESIRRCHVNLGHPSKERFLHMLKSAGASEKAIKVAKEFQCSVCLQNTPKESSCCENEES